MADNDPNSMFNPYYVPSAEQQTPNISDNIAKLMLMSNASTAGQTPSEDRITQLLKALMAQNQMGAMNQNPMGQYGTNAAGSGGASRGISNMLALAGLAKMMYGAFGSGGGAGAGGAVEDLSIPSLGS